MHEEKPQKDLLTRLADAGEEALQRLSEAPGMERATELAKSTRRQLEELTKRVQGIGALEARIEKLEQQVAAMQKEPTESVPPRETVAAREPPPTAAP